MRVRHRVRRRIGVAVLAVATTVVATPHAQATPARTETVEVTPPKKSARRHWGGYGGWFRGLQSTVQRHPSIVEIVLAKARAQLGKAYVYGSAGPNTFDCSGFTQFAYAAAGVDLPHNAAAQYDAIRHVALKDARPGDLVFSGYGGIGHVGIYIGGGRMIHAPHSGARVEVAPLRGNTVGAGRPAPSGH